MRSKSTFRGLYVAGGEFSFTEGKKYKSVEFQGGFVIMDDNGKGVKFSKEETEDNFYLDN